jgi:chromosome segregation ATPase
MTRKEQKKEGRAGQIEKKLDQDMTDLLEYVSWMSGQNA